MRRSRKPPLCDDPGHHRRRRFDRFPLAHYLRARLHRTLFAYFGVTIVVASGLGLMAVVFGRADGGPTDFERLERFVGGRFAHVWRDPVARRELAESAARDLGLGVRLVDATGTQLEAIGPACAHGELAVPVEDAGVRLGRAAFCVEPHRRGPRFLLPFLVALVVLWAASGKLARRLARPLADVARVAREIGRGNLESRAHLDRYTPGEVGVLAMSINDMAMRIESQIRDQRVLLAAVSHELRTPLGHARILLELLRDRGAEARSIDELERELVEIDTLVGELLASSRLDFSILNLRDVDAADLARHALDRAGIPGERLEAPTGKALFSGDPTLLGRALANLLDNAQKHGKGVVTLRAAVDDTRVRFEVDDAGPGIPEARMADLFTPFYRTPGEADAPSLEPRGDSGTLGLGLSLVNRIAEAHGGRAFARPHPSGVGATVGLEIPRSPPAKSA